MVVAVKYGDPIQQLGFMEFRQQFGLTEYLATVGVQQY
jgi:hypothetical protein